MSDVVVAAGRLPWEMQPVESVPAFRAFARYRDMVEGRSITKVAQELHKSRTLVARWSSEHDWQRRIEAWELHQDRRLMEARECERQRIDREQIGEGRLLRLAAMRRIAGAPEDGVTGIDWDAVGVRETLAAYRLGRDTERQAAGLGLGSSVGTITMTQASQIILEVFEAVIELVPKERQNEAIRRVHAIGEGRSR